MIKGIYLSASGMLPSEIKQNAMANNVANLNTPGFKRDSVFYRELARSTASLRKSGYPEWHRERVEETYIDFGQGQVQQTNRPLDVAIYGEGFFSISTPQGIRYTRNGSFSTNSQGILVDSGGNPVLGESGPITIPQEAQTIAISDDGEIFVDGVSIDRLKLVDFPKPYPLLKDQTGGVFMARPGAEEQPVGVDTTINQGTLESSNSLGIHEMVDMLDVYRNYESNQRAIQTQNDTLGRAINDVGVVGT
ncbi:MAG: flagellar basal-body rod protein FlgF [Candidatus Latescibacteria bacterium]|nr:flagellar basal-body rod protein FlgF [Candidatus Latescibacterota bacterium]